MKRFSFSALAFILICGLLARFLLALISPLTIDTAQYTITADAVLSGANVYAAQANYNYSPVFAYALAFVRAVTGDNFTLAVRLLLGVGDGFTALAIYALGGRKAFVCYWLNPASMVIVGYWSQFDTLALALLLWSAYCARLFCSSTSSSGWRGSSRSTLSERAAPFS